MGPHNYFSDYFHNYLSANPKTTFAKKYMFLFIQGKMLGSIFWLTTHKENFNIIVFVKQGAFLSTNLVHVTLIFIYYILQLSSLWRPFTVL